MKTNHLLLALAGLIATPVIAQEITPKQSDVLKKLLATYTEKAKEEAKDTKGRGITIPYKPFTADAGREFYLQRRTWQATDYTCSGCHTTNPAKEGKHIDTNKSIKPLAPAFNPERFTDAKKVEENFTEHCRDLHDRDCRAMEKGNFIAYLMSIK